MLKDPKTSKLHKIDDFFTIKTPPGYPWVSRGQLGSIESYLRGLELDHQVSGRLDANNLSKIALFDQILLLFRGFLHLVFLKLDGRV